MPWSLDVGVVIKVYHHLITRGGGGAGIHPSSESSVLAMAPHSAYIMNRKLQSHSQFQSVPVATFHEKKAMPPDDGKHLECSHHKQRMAQFELHMNCGRSENTKI